MGVLGQRHEKLFNFHDFKILIIDRFLKEHPTYSKNYIFDGKFREESLGAKYRLGGGGGNYPDLEEEEGKPLVEH